ncbi:MAG: 2-C-methyl-D-erythritol 2,4-cyclodiphosphate synthase [Ignavibacteria bacterium]|nr:2-C-methyl-D-erythritol 2,4-cyclodiphosphate synthase [Ignavibacteria bacterium]
MVGFGFDVHKLIPGNSLTLGGVVVPSDITALAHSDGDVVLHALVDALLGSVGLGDIGDHFPDTDSTWKDADSQLFVRETHLLLVEAGFTVTNIDVTIILEKPKLAQYKGEMKNVIAELCHIPAERVNVKATTSELLGYVGRGEGVCAHVVCQVDLI